MSDGSLSQQEIDALLESGNDVNVNQAGLATPGMVQERLQLFEELLRSVIPNQKQSLHNAVNTRSSIELSSNTLADLDVIGDDLGEHAVQIVRGIAGADKGEISFLISEKDALQAAAYIIGQDDLEVNDVLLGALQEMVISISEPILHALGNSRGAPVDIENTATNHLPVSNITLPNSPAVITTYNIALKSRTIRLYMTLDPALLDQVHPIHDQQEAGIDSAHATIQESAAPHPAPLPTRSAERSVSQAAPATVRSARFDQFDEPASPSNQANLGLLMDVDMELTVELGRTRRQVRDVLQMGEGSIIELDKLAGEPIDILVNRRLIAKGEVVVIDENFGVRVTEVIDPVHPLTDF